MIATEGRIQTGIVATERPYLYMKCEIMGIYKEKLLIHLKDMGKTEQ
jgi:hypothetical protein